MSIPRRADEPVVYRVSPGGMQSAGSGSRGIILARMAGEVAHRTVMTSAGAARGAYTAMSFWDGFTAVRLRARPFWEVGLDRRSRLQLCIVPHRSLANSILAHAVTNGCLSVYVLTTGQWTYWL